MNLLKNLFGQNNSPESKLNIVSAVPEEVMGEIRSMENHTIIQRVDSNSIKEIRFVMGSIDSYPNNSGIFSSVGPFVVSWQHPQYGKDIREQVFVGFGKEIAVEKNIIYVPVFEGYSANEKVSSGINTYFYLKLLRQSNGILQITNGQKGDLWKRFEAINFEGVASQQVFTYNINSEGKTPIWFIDGK
jgi:hypothetical protein